MMGRYAFDTRNRLISLASYGRITPQEAEAKAAARGLPPLESRPALPTFDPMQQSRWPLVTAIAWIAWRDLKLTREVCPEFRAECAHWIFREWSRPIGDGTAFARHAGWFLERWQPATALRLQLMDFTQALHNEVPAGRQMSVRQAQQQLWGALSDGILIAEGLDGTGKPVDVPPREWSYLRLFEERDRDTLKYDALDRGEPFTKIKLKRNDIVRIWPPMLPPKVEQDAWPITPAMLKPVADGGDAGYVPLCCALQWIMTEGGTHALEMNDEAEWQSAVDRLWPLVCGGDLELIGLRSGDSLTQRIPGHTLALVRVLPPLHNDFGDILVGSPSHIVCTPYVDWEHWSRDFDDRLYEYGIGPPTWNHLQVRKSQILERWPRPVGTAKLQLSCQRWLADQMQASPTRRPRSREAFWTEAQEKFPALAERQFIRAWQNAIVETGAYGWSKAGRPSKKSNHRGS